MQDAEAGGIVNQSRLEAIWAYNWNKPGLPSAAQINGCYHKLVSAKDQKAEKAASVGARVNSRANLVVWQLVFNQKLICTRNIHGNI